MGIDASYNYRPVSDAITTSGLVPVEALGELRAEGYDAVINLKPDIEAEIGADEGQIVRDQGLDYVYLPVDFDAPTHADYEAFAAAMDAHDGQKVHVHCAANYRVTAFYGVYAMDRGLWTEVEADAFVRDVWDPSEFPAWQAFITDERERISRQGPRTAST
jgi:protein tyrosine phosphatase (PTP) superfamily phosphohydrolase (DUF442 family)